MQQDNQTFPAFTSFNKLFSPERRRNRLEFIDDFPNDAQVISSLQIHPMGWCALSRNVSDEETEEVSIFFIVKYIAFINRFLKQKYQVYLTYNKGKKF